MNRRNFLKSGIFAAISLALFPKDLLSKSNNKEEDSLIKFAKSFSKNYKTLSTGVYTSNCGKYKIEYLEKIVDGQYGIELNTPYRVNNITGVMQFSKSKLKHYKESYVFQGIIWCQCILKHSDYLKADIESIQIALENGFSKKELFSQNIKCFRTSGMNINEQRLRNLLNNYEQKKQST